MTTSINSKNKILFKIAEKKKNQVLFLVFASLSLLVMITIFLFSAQAAETSAELSGKVGSFVERVLSLLKWIFNDDAVLWIITYLRKIAHFVLYAILGGFLLATFLNTKIQKPYLKMIFAAMIALFYSITDEIHQLFIDGRSGQVSDVLLDFSGAICGIFICLLIYKIIKHLTKDNKKSNS